MFLNSIVTPAELTAYKERTAKMLSVENGIDNGLTKAIQAFQAWDNIATVWCCEGHIRIENGKPRTRKSHYLVFVATEEGMKDIEFLYNQWQEHELGDRFHLVLVRLHCQDDKSQRYGAWSFRLNYRPDPEIVATVCSNWERIANFTNSTL